MKWFQVSLPLVGSQASTVRWEGAADDGEYPVYARRGDWQVVGIARIDHPLVAQRRSNARAVPVDLDWILEVIEQRGAAAPSHLVGDFAFVAWHHDGTVIAARDPLGVCTLFASQIGNSVAFASRLQLLRTRDNYDPAFIAEFLVNGYDTSGHTIYENVKSVTPGSCCTLTNGVLRETRYWDAASFEPMRITDERRAVEEFGELFREAVSYRLTDPPQTWAELSGGLDSSSIVVVAHRLAATQSVRLGGTVTMVDTLGGGDERCYSDQVVKQCDVRNELIFDYWPFMDDGEGPPMSDQPTANYPFFAAQRRICSVIARAGGTSLLSGQGSDHYLAGNYAFVADLLGRGRLIRAAREIMNYASNSRVSAWRFGFNYGVIPLLPLSARARLMPRRRRLPRWIRERFARSFEMEPRLSYLRHASGSIGRKYSTQVASELALLTNAFRGPFEDWIRLTYPFTHRPLVEFALQLPYQFRTQPREKKWILREALRGILPEDIRTRVGKGTTGARTRWALAREQQQLDELAKAPLLAELGCIEPVAFRKDLADLQTGRKRRTAYMMNALALEMWLRVRAGKRIVRRPALEQQSEKRQAVQTI